RDRVVRQRSLKTGEPVSPPLPHGEEVKAAAVSRDGSLVLTATESGARLWEVATGKPGATFSPPGKVYAAALSSDGRTVLTRTAEGKPSEGGQTDAHRWDVKTGGELTPSFTFEEKALALALSPDGQTLVTARRKDGVLVLWDVRTGKSQGPLAVPRGGYQSLAYSPDGRALLTGSGDQTARLWDCGTGRPLGPTLFHGGPVPAVAGCGHARPRLAA